MTNKKINDITGLSVEISVWSSVWNPVWCYVAGSVWTSVRDTVLSISIGRSVINLVEDSVYNYFNNEL